MSVRLYHGDMREVLATYGAETIDAVVCDPPYELGFMGKKWDGFGVSFDAATWRACLRVLKPGGHLLAFGGTRTVHRIAVAIEDAGFEIRDQIVWMYGSGFPKSLNVGKAIDAAAGAERQVVGQRKTGADSKPDSGTFRPTKRTYRTEDGSVVFDVTAPATDLARRYDGYGTALKPAMEPIVVARKPLIGTVAANVTAHGTGALNIDGCRIGEASSAGRWPANVALDEEAAEMLDAQSGASRFYYVAKASRSERNAGLDGMAVVAQNHHPTVKPIALMRWLIRLVSPPDGAVILDPFLGSGTTGIAAVMEDVHFVGIEQSAEYLEIARRRIAHAQGPLFAQVNG